MKEIQFLVYGTDEEVEVLVRGETIWATQKTISELFDVDRTTISRHLKNIFETGELEEKVVCAEIAHTTQHGAIEGKMQKSQQYTIRIANCWFKKSLIVIFDSFKGLTVNF